MVKVREVEDVEREAQAGQKGKRKRRKGGLEDLEFMDTGGNVYILTVRSVNNHGLAQGWPLCLLTDPPSPSRGRLRRSLNC